MERSSRRTTATRIRHAGGLWFAAVAAAWATCLPGARPAGAVVASFDDVRYYVGSGANRAAIVVDWNGDAASDGALAWGFRWDGSATGADMLAAIVAADPRLFAKLGDNGPLGLAVRGLGYDLNDDAQFALDDDTVFDAAGVAASGPADGASPVDPADRYREGWFTGIWTYATANANPWSGGAWTFSGIGPSGRTLVDGAWDSWAFTPTFRQSAAAANASAAAPPADFDSDGVVDGDDFLTWQRGLGLGPPALRSQGDATRDGAVDPADLAMWTSQFHGGASTIAAAHPAAAAPEPHSIAVGACAALVLLSVGRLHNRRAS